MYLLLEVRDRVQHFVLRSTGMDNYMMYTGNDGVYTHTVKYERDSMCPVCSPGVPLRLARCVCECCDCLRVHVSHL